MSTEYKEFHIAPACPHAQPPPLSTSCTRVIHLLQSEPTLIYQGACIISQSPSFLYIRVLWYIPWVFDRCMTTGIHYYNITWNSVTALKILCALRIHPSLLPATHLPHPQPLASPELPTVSIVSLFPEWPIIGIR